jgi:hypothetical protein
MTNNAATDAAPPGFIHPSLSYEEARAATPNC